MLTTFSCTLGRLLQNISTLNLFLQMPEPAAQYADSFAVLSLVYNASKRLHQQDVLHIGNSGLT